MPNRTIAVLRVVTVATIVLVAACTDQTGAGPTTTVPVTVGGAGETTAPPPTAAPTTGAPTSAAPTTVVVPEGPPVAPGALRVTLGDAYVDAADFLPAGLLTFDIWNGGQGDHALRIIDLATDQQVLESRPLAPQEWEILDVDLAPGLYSFESDAAAVEINVTG